MNCMFKYNCDSIKVFCSELLTSAWEEGYNLVVLGIGKDGLNYNNVGRLHLSEEDVKELVAQELIKSPNDLVGRKMMIASNQLCRRAGIQHLNIALSAAEWSAVENTISEEERRSLEESQESWDDEGEEY